MLKPKKHPALWALFLLVAHRMASHSLKHITQGEGQPIQLQPLKLQASGLRQQEGKRPPSCVRSLVEKNCLFWGAPVPVPWWQGVISPQRVPGCWRAAVRGARGRATTTSVTRATMRLWDKAIGNTFMSQFLCNWITLLHGEGERRRKKRRYFLLVQKQTHGYSYPSRCASWFHKDVRRKDFPVAKYPGKEISQLLNYSFIWNWALCETLWTWKQEETQPPPGLT